MGGVSNRDERMSSAPDLALRHLAKVVESTDDAIVSKDLSSTIVSWNRAAERMFGYTAEEAIGRSIRMIIPADRQGEEDEVLATVRAGRSVTHYETVRQRKDGSLIDISLTVSPIYDDAGVVIGASKIARDITEQKLATSALRRLAAVVASSDDAIVSKTLDGVITSWNRAAERMFGYTEAEAVGRSVRMLIPNELQSEEDTVLARLRAGLAIEHYETVRQRKDGSRLSISLTVSPIFGEAGQVVGASKIARDITEQVRLRQLADEHAAVTEKLSEVGAIVASSLDRDTIVKRVTDTARELTKAEVGAFFYNMRAADAGDAYLTDTLSGARKGTLSTLPDPRALYAPIFQGEATIRLDDVTADARFDQRPPLLALVSERVPVRSYLAVPVRGMRGDVIGGLFFGSPRVGVFTEQHQRIAEGIAGWAAVALENARLLVEAREANRMKDEFLAVLSHELRTPLNAIVGYARLLRGGMLAGDKLTRGLETLERNANWLTQIIEDVLDVSRIVTGKIRLDVQAVQLPVIIDNAIATVQPAADAKGVRLQTIVDFGVGPISGDPDRLQQVLWNLLTNAVKFSGRGGRVQVRLERVNSHVEVSVSDTGVGIPPDFLPFVFERFRQADAGTTRKAGGLGLGLAIVRHLVEMHGGTVDATSAGENAGATFRVRLPLMIVHPRASEPPREHPNTMSNLPLNGLDDLSGVRVVAIDDEPDALSLLRVVLETAGAAVTTFASPIAALTQVAVERPDALIVDVGMPEMDGYDFIRRVRASPEAAMHDVPAAALTAFARAEDRTRALQSGFEMHLAKPVDPGELVAAVATLVRRARLRR
jgi:PAS domain S-box-containing protein